MKKYLVIFLVFLLPTFSFGQNSFRSIFGLYGGMVLNHSFGDHWYNERGARIGISTTLRQFGDTLYGESLFNASFDISLQITGAKKHQHISGIQTTIFDFLGNSEGFGRVEFSRVSPTLMYNFGFKLHSESIVNPYATTGLRMDFYYSRFYEELYTDDLVNIGANATTPITNTSTLGLGLGVGTKFLFSERFNIDVRYELFSNWALNTNTHRRLPDLESFNHVGPGIPLYQLRDRRFQSGGALSVNMIIFFRD